MKGRPISHWILLGVCKLFVFSAPGVALIPAVGHQISAAMWVFGKGVIESLEERVDI